MISVALATEDELSEAVGKRLLASTRHECGVGMLLRRNGAGYLRKRMKSWCEMATGDQPIVLITDLDGKQCAPAHVAKWIGEHVHPVGLVFRVAVREIESWLLADHEGIQRLLGPRARLHPNPDSLPDPKRHLLKLAGTARREVREDLIATRGATAGQGLGYNARLCAFVADEWNPDRAQTRSDSLRRARARIDELAQRLAKA